MALPSWRLHLSPEHFDGSEVVCLGWQLARVVEAFAASRPRLRWYWADVDTNGANQLFQAPAGAVVLVGSGDALVALANQVHQFLRGVFFGVPEDIEAPRFRPRPDTEDCVVSDLGDARVEVRTFDTSYIEVFAAEKAALKPVQKTFPKAKMTRLE